jgi:hypothetical protein
MVPFSLAVLSRRHSDSFSPVHRVAGYALLIMSGSRPGGYPNELAGGLLSPRPSLRIEVAQAV